MMDLFSTRRETGSLAVIDGLRPIGLINRDIFISKVRSIGVFPILTITFCAAHS
jgi:hypothetical protein